MTRILDRAGYATRGDLQDALAELRRSLEGGEVQIPVVTPATANHAGGPNHWPNSDLSFSTLAATVTGTLPGDAGDLNYEAYRFYRQHVVDNATLDADHALKAEGHSLYAAEEGTNTIVPIWDRENGWLVIGSTGTQYDILVQLPSKIVSPGQKWFILFRIVALDPAVVPSNVEVYAGIWVKGSSEGWATGGAFDITYDIWGIPGTTSIDYRVLAKTDSGVSILSNILTVADAPNTLSSANYVRLFYNAGPGFTTFEIYRKVGSVYTYLFTAQNSTDLQYNDINNTPTHRPATGWPTVSGNAPQAYAETRSLAIAAYNTEWKLNELRIDIPSTYDSTDTDDDGQFIRIGLTNPTGVDRHLGIDRFVFDTTYHEWSPDVLPPFSDGTFPIPTVSPTSGNQGGGDGVHEPPFGGSGGQTCILENMPVLLSNKTWRQYKNVRLSASLKGERRTPYAVLKKRGGMVAEYYIIKTKNGITYECSKDHQFIVDLKTRKRLRAQHVIEGETRIACWVKGRNTTTLVISKKFVPESKEVGTFTLRDMSGVHRDGEGIYIAGRSKDMDRGLYASNLKP